MRKAQAWVRAVHGSVGALLILYVLVSSLSGTLLLWKASYLRLTIPEARVDFEPTAEALAAIR